jgi:predicted ATPase/DNA-binding CsgD family transcriptional regulator
MASDRLHHRRPALARRVRPAGRLGGGRPAARLPVPLTSFVGRHHEVGEVRRLLATTRLLTLTGTGGVGKTRLALRVAAEVAASAPETVWSVQLASVEDPRLLPRTVAGALGVVDQPGRRPLDGVIEQLGERAWLLLLDNCEHLVAACAELAEALLRACPGLRVLATSREPLGAAGETTWRVPSLGLPGAEAAPTVAVVAGSEAGQLFAARAAAVRPTFALDERNAPVVARICQRLDGIPLAIELAAARLTALSPDEVLAHLDDRFGLLTGGSRTALPRHRTLRGTVDWSHELLPPAERVLFRRLAVFSGGWTLAAAEAICAGSGPDGSGQGIGPISVAADDVLDLLTQLVVKSLVLSEEAEGETRYRFLETNRQYAREKLQAAGEEAAVRDRHHAWCLELAERAAPTLRGPDAKEWLDRLEQEHDNLRGALAWAAERERGPMLARLSAALWWFWFWRYYFAEGRRWLGTAMAASADLPVGLRASLLHGDGLLARALAEYAASAARLEQSIGLYRALGDRAGEADALYDLARTAAHRGDYARATELHEASLALRRALDDGFHVNQSLRGLGLLHMQRGELDRASAALEESLALARALGSPRALASTLSDVGRFAQYVGDDERAEAMLEEGASLFRANGDRRQTSQTLSVLAVSALRRGDLGRASLVLRESLAIVRELGARRDITECLEVAASIAVARGDWPRAARLLGTCETQRAATGLALPRSARADHDRTVNAARRAMGEGAFAAALAEGRAAPLEEAVALVLEGEAGPGPEPPAPHDARLTLLTPREREVAGLIAQRLTNRQIAERLVVSERTVHAHVRNVLAKLELASRAQVADWFESTVAR